MPFAKTPETLNGLIDKTIEEDRQLRESLEEVGYEGREIYDEIAAVSDRIWEVALDEIKKYESAEHEYESLVDRSNEEAGEEPREIDAKISASTAWIGVLLGLYVLGLMVWGLYELVQDWRQTFGALATQHGWTVIGAAIAPIVVLGVINGLIYRRKNRNQTARQADLKLRREEWRKKQDDIKTKYGIDSAGAALRVQESAIGKLLFERVRQETVSAINRRTAPSYAPRFEIKRPRGFGEVFDKRFTIQTPARKRLQFMLQNMSGGSIGIAGSRGAGKTTLIRLFCGPKRVIDKLNSKPVLGVLVSAPVAYEARDFILYLFSTACQNVIEAEGGKYTPPGLPSDAPPTRLENVRGFVALRPLPFLLIRFGLVLALVSSLIALGIATLQPSVPVASTTSQSASLPATTNQPPAATASATQQQEEERSNLGRVEKPPQAQQSSGTQSQNTQSASPRTRNDVKSLVFRWMSLLKIDPAPLVVWGGTFTIVGLMLAEFLRLGAWRTFLISVAQLLHATVGSIPIYGRLTGAFLGSQRMKAREEAERRHPRSAEDSMATPLEDSLLGHAEMWLKAIKFQQSYTSGWSGSLKLPIGLEGGVNRAVTLAQNQLSLPEIGYFFMQFLEEASLKYQVIIGIDEMDKLASDELAQQFINDIKSIFGLERCFYLISVSENAMSNFERRGLPFRDVFDSAFDDFVYVDHLNFESAKELLEQRVVGRPILFFAMSYCMSGGLARDLIRNFRSVLEVHEQDKDHNSLTAICRKVVESDLLAKVRATRTSAKKIKIEPEVDQFLESLYALEVGVDSDDLLVKAASALLAMTAAQESSAKPVQAPITARTRHRIKEPSQPGVRSANDQQTTSEDKDRVSKATELRDLAEELATYIHYAVTLRQLFNDELKETALTNPPLNGNLDALAKARQVLGVNPAITRALLRSFRDAHGLAAFP